jgi:hypothetical protein
MTTPPATPPGWYPDPSDAGGQRYWDGSQWTAQTAPRVAAGMAPGGPGGPGGPGAPGGRTEPLAIWSLVLSLLGFLCGISAVAGVICGHLALGSIKRNGTGGRGLAIAGLVIGYLLILVTVAVVVLVLLGGSSNT